MRSTHWGIPHVMHQAPGEQKVTQLLPHVDFNRTWYSIFGFDGKVVRGDKREAERGPMPTAGIFVGIVFLWVFSVLWLVANLLGREKHT